MVHRSKEEYLEAIRPRYRRVNRANKKRILDEFCDTCGHHRKHAIRLLRDRPKAKRAPPGRPAEYGAPERAVLEVIWLAANRPCAGRLRAAIPEWLPHYEKDFQRLLPEIRERLLKVSGRSLDRLLEPVRKVHGTRGKCGTRPGSVIRELIPIRIDHSDVTQPGTMAADTVAHCGNSMEGNFVWSLTMTDIYSGWTENRAVWNKGYTGVHQAIMSIQEGLPFPLTGFHSDNGGEFLNHHLIRYFQESKTPVSMTRGRPRHRNDNPHVEQKNYTHVRLLLGFGRLEQEAAIPVLNQLYAATSLFNNYFAPTLKLIGKKKIGSRYLKTYDTPRTPYRRLMESPHVSEAHKTHMTEVFLNLNPFKLKRLIDHLQSQILKRPSVT